MNVGLAEVVGFFIGDGCLSKSPRMNRPSESKTFLLTGSSNRNSEEYFNHLNNILFENFKVKCNLYHRKDNDVFLLRTGNKDIINFFLSLGYSFGPKSRTIFIPQEILKNRLLTISCLRGIFNSDGSIYRRYSKRYSSHPKHYSNLFNIQFKSMSSILINQINNILEEEEIKCNKIIVDKTTNAYVLRITSQKDVLKFLDTVQVNHPYHKEKIKRIQRDLNPRPPGFSNRASF